MSREVEFVVRTLLIGIGATLVMDVWLVAHEQIAKALPVRCELVLGWCAHSA